MNRETRRHQFVVAYDISDDRRRSEVFETCRDHGNRVQYSVFLCQLDRREVAVLRDALRKIIDHVTDQVLFVDLGPATYQAEDRIEAIGKAYCAPRRDFVV